MRNLVRSTSNVLNGQKAKPLSGDLECENPAGAITVKTLEERMTSGGAGKATASTETPRGNGVTGRHLCTAPCLSGPHSVDAVVPRSFPVVLFPSCSSVGRSRL